MYRLVVEADVSDKDVQLAVVATHGAEVIVAEEDAQLALRHTYWYMSAKSHARTHAHTHTHTHTRKQAHNASSETPAGT